MMLGPMLASAALELSGVISGAAPDSHPHSGQHRAGHDDRLALLAFHLHGVPRGAGRGLLGFLIALVIAMAGAGIAACGPGLPFALTLLAFSPGGLDAMTIMAFSLNLDPAYVGAHQMARYIGLALLMPLVTAYVLKRMGAHANVTSAAADSQARGTLMEGLRHLLPYKGIVVLGALALLLALERLFPLARVVGRCAARGPQPVARRAQCRAVLGGGGAGLGLRGLPRAGLAAGVVERLDGAADRSRACSTAGSTGGTGPTMNGRSCGASMRCITSMSSSMRVRHCASTSARC